MTKGIKPTKLFKAAKTYNVSSATIVETLKEKGFSIKNKLNETISVEMIVALDEVYGLDKEKSKEHERSREEYHEMRSSMKNRQNEKVTIDTIDTLDPIDDLQPMDDEPVAPEGGLQPVDDLPLAPLDEPVLEPIDDKTETSEVEPVAKSTKEEIEPETKKPAPVKEEEKTSVPEPTVEPAPKVEAPTPKPAVVEEPPKTGVETPKAKEVTPEEPKKEAETTPPISEEPTKKSEEEAVTAEAPKEPAEKEGSAEEVVADESDVEPELADDTPPEVIRANTEKLRGTRVLGMVDIGRKKPAKKKEEPKKEEKAADDEAAKKKKRKKRLKRPKDTTTTNTTTTSDSNKSKNKSKRKVVDAEDVDQKMKETLAKMQGSGSNKKRQKIRRKKRDDMAEAREEEALKKQIEQETLEVTEFITTSELAELLDVNVNQIIMAVMSIGLMVSINQRLDASTIELIAGEFDREVKFVDAEEMLEEPLEAEDAPEDLEPRAPVVTIMGHVDHGKTSLLDYIRRTKVAAGEAGGITQHIGAYSVTLDDGRKIAFLDTPGHEAFTAMRARGAQVTDIVILVVAADDSVMPQTIEAINHAQAAGVPLIIAINKMDKEGANPDRIKAQLTEHNVVIEEYGGSVQVAEVSAHTGKNVDELLEKVLIEAELLELKANPDRLAAGIVLEAQIDKGKGVVANILVQNGTMKIGDFYIAGQHFGRVRAMENELGQRLKEVGPSTPIQLTGFDGMPQAGDRIICMSDERKAKEIAQQRQQLKREQSMRMVKHVTLDDLSRRMALGEVSDLNIIIKGDVDGSIEALAGSLQKLSTDEVQVKIIHTGVGGISESDVLLASASDAIIIGFQVRPSSNARKLAEQEQIDIRLFSVIYDAVDEVKEAMEGLLSPEIKEKIQGSANVRDTFKVPGVGMVAGCYITEGKVFRNSKVRLIRDGIVIYDGLIDSLKRFKDDVKEVANGYECGISIVNYNDIKVGDVIEAYEEFEQKRTLN